MSDVLQTPFGPFLKLGVPHDSILLHILLPFHNLSPFGLCGFNSALNAGDYSICITIPISLDLQTLIAFIPVCFYGNCLQHNTYKLFFFLNLCVLLNPLSI